MHYPSDLFFFFILFLLLFFATRLAAAAVCCWLMENTRRLVDGGEPILYGVSCLTFSCRHAAGINLRQRARVILLLIWPFLGRLAGPKVFGERGKVCKLVIEILAAWAEFLGFRMNLKLKYLLFSVLLIVCQVEFKKFHNFDDSIYESAKKLNAKIYNFCLLYYL